MLAAVLIRVNVLPLKQSSQATRTPSLQVAFDSAPPLRTVYIAKLHYRGAGANVLRRTFPYHAMPQFTTSVIWSIGAVAEGPALRVWLLLVVAPRRASFSMMSVVLQSNKDRLVADVQNSS